MTFEPLKITFYQLCVRIENSLDELATNLYCAEKLFGILNVHNHERKSNRTKIKVNDKYLNELQAHVYSLKFRLSVLQDIYSKGLMNGQNRFARPQRNKTNETLRFLISIEQEMSQIIAIFNILSRTFIHRKNTLLMQSHSKKPKTLTSLQLNCIAQTQLQLLCKDSVIYDPQNLNISRMMDMDKSIDMQHASIASSSMFEYDTFYKGDEKEKERQQPKPKPKIIKKGMLAKQGRVRGKWKKRLFALYDDAHIRYYNNAKSLKLLGEIALINIAYAAPNATLYPGQKNVFSIKTHQREFVLGADSSASRNDWIEAINLATKAHYQKQNGSPLAQSVVSSSYSVTKGLPSSYSNASDSLNFLDVVNNISGSSGVSGVSTGTGLSSISQVSGFNFNSNKSDSKSNADLRENVRCNFVGKHELLYDLDEVQFSDLSISSTFVELQEQLAGVAIIQLIASRQQLKIVEKYQEEEESNTNNDVITIDWQTIINTIELFFHHSHGDVLTQGYMTMKKSGKKWKKRWVVLRREFLLEWYLTPQDAKAGVLNYHNYCDLKEIIGVHEVISGQYDLIKHELDFVFEVEFEAGNNIKFACDTKTQLRLWIDKIQTHPEYCRALEDDDDYLVSSINKSNRMIDPVII